MKNFSKIGLFAVALAFFFGTVAVSESNAQGALNKILKRMDVHQKSLQSVEANVMMAKYDSTLDISDVTSGNTFYIPGKGTNVTARVNWTKPLQETLVVKGGKYILYRPKLKQAIVGKVSEANKNTKTNSALDFMGMSKRDLSSNYRIQKLDNVVMNKQEVWHLRLTPKTKKSYKYAELWVDGNGMPLQAKIVEKNDDSTTVRLSKIKKNVAFKKAIFKLDLPKGTNIVDG